MHAPGAWQVKWLIGEKKHDKLKMREPNLATCPSISATEPSQFSVSLCFVPHEVELSYYMYFFCLVICICMWVMPVSSFIAESSQVLYLEIIRSLLQISYWKLSHFRYFLRMLFNSEDPTAYWIDIHSFVLVIIVLFLPKNQIIEWCLLSNHK